MLPLLMTTYLTNQEKHYSRRPWILEDETGEHQYQGQIEDPPATYYSLTLKGKEITAVPVGSCLPGRALPPPLLFFCCL